MSPVLVFTLFALCAATPIKKPNVEPEYLDMLRATGQDEEFARLMGIDVSLVRAPEERSEEDLIFTKVSDLGDILLTPEQEEQARQNVRPDNYPKSLWPNKQIPYVISSSDFSSAQIQRITEGIRRLNSRTKNLTIVPRDRQSDYAMIISGNGCYSNLGRVGGQQTISLQKSGCLNYGNITHELMHAAGFTHEHNRPDRDEYVTVLFQNIPREWQSQYQKGNSNDFGNMVTYDYYSLMHHPMNAPGTNKPAFEVLDPTIDSRKLGQRDGPTELDIQKVDTLYSF